MLLDANGYILGSKEKFFPPEVRKDYRPREIKANEKDMEFLELIKTHSQSEIARLWGVSRQSISQRKIKLQRRENKAL